MYCDANVKEPSEAPPHHLGSGIFVFKRGEIDYQYSCQEMIFKLLEAEHCYSDIPIYQVKKSKLLSITMTSRMLITSSTKEPCVPHISKALHGRDVNVSIFLDFSFRYGSVHQKYKRLKRYVAHYKILWHRVTLRYEFSALEYLIQR